MATVYITMAVQCLAWCLWKAATAFIIVYLPGVSFHGHLQLKFSLEQNKPYRISSASAVHLASTRAASSNVAQLENQHDLGISD